MAGITLSDPFCVDRHRGDFRELVQELDYVLGNEHEWCALYETEDLGAALEQAAAESGLVVCTRSGHDVVIATGGDTLTVPVTRGAGARQHRRGRSVRRRLPLRRGDRRAA